MSNEAKRLLMFFDRNKSRNKADKISNMLNKYADLAINEGSPLQRSIPGLEDSSKSKATLLKEAMNFADSDFENDNNTNNDNNQNTDNNLDKNSEINKNKPEQNNTNPITQSSISNKKNLKPLSPDRFGTGKNPFGRMNDITNLQNKLKQRIQDNQDNNQHNQLIQKDVVNPDFKIGMSKDDIISAFLKAVGDDKFAMIANKLFSKHDFDASLPIPQNSKFKNIITQINNMNNDIMSDEDIISKIKDLLQNLSHEDLFHFFNDVGVTLDNNKNNSQLINDFAKKINSELSTWKEAIRDSLSSPTYDFIDALDEQQRILSSNETYNQYYNDTNFKLNSLRSSKNNNLFSNTRDFINKAIDNISERLYSKSSVRHAENKIFKLYLPIASTMAQNKNDAIILAKATSKMVVALNKFLADSGISLDDKLKNYNVQIDVFNTILKNGELVAFDKYGHKVKDFKRGYTHILKPGEKDDFVPLPATHGAILILGLLNVPVYAKRAYNDPDDHKQIIHKYSPYDIPAIILYLL